MYSQEVVSRFYCDIRGSAKTKRTDFKKLRTNGLFFKILYALDKNHYQAVVG